LKLDLKILNAGDSALFCNFGDKISIEINNEVYALDRYIKSKVNSVIETVPSYTGLMVYFNPIKTDREELLVEIMKFSGSTENGEIDKQSEKIVIPVFYGKEYGPDLYHVAEINKLSIDEVVEIHISVNYRVYMLGFTPGFPYLGGMDRCIYAPRKDEPRLKISAGSVGIAGDQTGIYPIESPGGWQIIGRTPVRLFSPDSNNPFLIIPGQLLQFRKIEFEEYIYINREVNNNTYLPETSILQP
jgi:KipI family sensor histidine kinase inhibitor